MGTKEKDNKTAEIQAQAQIEAAKLGKQGQIEAAEVNTVRGLNADGKILLEAFNSFSKEGMSTDKSAKLERIDEVLKDASIQLTRNGGAVISTSDGQSVKVSPVR